MLAANAAPDTSPTLLGRLRAFPADEEAWREFIAIYGVHLLRWARHWGLQESDAEDVTQATLMKLAKAMRHFDYDPELRFRGWLRTLAHHAWRDLVRTKKPLTWAGAEDDNPLHSLEAKVELTAAIESAFDEELLRKAMGKVRLRVEESTWEAFQLTALEGISGAEAALKLGVRLTSIYKARSNVLKMLQEEVRHLEEECHALRMSP